MAECGHEDPLRRPRFLDHLLPFLRSCGQRLFAKHVSARVQSGDGDISMGVRRSGDDYRVRLLRPEHLAVIGIGFRACALCSGPGGL